jgi:hypothetical protein
MAGIVAIFHSHYTPILILAQHYTTLIGRLHIKPL